MKLTKSKLKRIIKEELARFLSEALVTPSKLVGDHGTSALRGVSAIPVPMDIAREYPTTGEFALENGEYNIRGQYLMYRLDNELWYMTFDNMETTQDWQNVEDALTGGGWKRSENASVYAAADYEVIR